MTLLEVFTVLGIISLLMSLLLPAVQRVRESARRVQCANHLRELSHACQGVLGALQRFPDYTEFAPRPFRSVSGHVELLPHLGESALYSQVNQEEEGSVVGEPIRSTHNRQFENHWIAVFHCPSDTGPTGGNNYRACIGTCPGFGPKPKPPYSHPETEPLRGIFAPANASPRDVVDGLSQTVLYSERVTGDGNRDGYDSFRDVAVLPRYDDELPNVVAAMCSRVPAGVSHFSSSGHTWLFGSYGHTAYNHVLTPNSKTPDCVGAAIIFTDLKAGAHTARSMHSGGVNVCMADGAVRFVADGIDLNIWRAIASIQGGEVVPEF